MPRAGIGGKDPATTSDTSTGMSEPPQGTTRRPLNLSLLESKKVATVYMI